MKNSFLVLFSLLSLSLFAQQGQYIIKGKVGRLNPPAKAYLMTITDTSFSKDSTFIKNGEFEFKGNIDDPYKAYIIVNHGNKIADPENIDILNLYLEKGLLTVVALDSVKNAQINGESAINAEYKYYNEKYLVDINAKKQKLDTEFYAATPKDKEAPEFWAKIDERDSIINKDLKVLQIRYIKEHPNSFISFDIIKEQWGEFPDYNELNSLFGQLSWEIRNSTFGKAFDAKLKQLGSISIGSIAPEIMQPSVIDGKIVKLSDFRGKYVLIDFWASWCGPCRKENPNVVKAYNQFKDKNFTVLGISLDENSSKAAWIKAIEKDGLSWNNVSDLKGWSNVAAQLYLVQSIPRNYLIDPDGRIVAKNLRGEELQLKLKEIFK